MMLFRSLMMAYVTQPSSKPVIKWSIQSGSWTESTNAVAYDNKQFTSISPGSNGSTVIRCTFSGVTSITFNCIYNGENNYDYLTVGSLDTTCTRSSYGTSLKGTSGTAKDITFTCDKGEHFVEFCYSKDGSVDTSPDNAAVYVKNVSNDQQIMLNLTTNQSTHTDINGAIITVKHSSTTKTFTWQGNTITYIIPAGESYTISYSKINGYSIPTSQTYKAVAGNIRTITATYNTTIVTVLMEDNQIDYNDIANTTATVNVDEIGNITLKSGQTIKVPTGISCTITWNSLSGYQTPSAQTFTTSGASVTKTGTYNTQILTVNVSGLSSGFTITVSGIGSQTTTSKTYKIPYGTSYTVSGSTVPNYNKSGDGSYTANSASNSVTITYTVLNGVFIATESGKLITSDVWDNSETAVGIAIIDDYIKVIVDLNAIVDLNWTDGLVDIEGVPTVVNQVEAQSQYLDGQTYTNAMLNYNSSGNYAAGACNNQTITFGNQILRGYLGSSGEWYRITRFYSGDIRSVCEILNNYNIYGPYEYIYIWTSVEKSINDVWTAYLEKEGTNTGMDYLLKYQENVSLAVNGAIPLYKFGN